MQGDLATKGDVQGLGRDLREVELTLRADLRQTEQKLKAEIDQLAQKYKAESEAAKSEILKWLIGAIGFQTLAIPGAVFALARVLRP